MTIEGEIWCTDKWRINIVRTHVWDAVRKETKIKGTHYVNCKENKLEKSSYL